MMGDYKSSAALDKIIKLAQKRMSFLNKPL